MSARGGGARRRFELGEDDVRIERVNEPALCVTGVLSGGWRFFAYRRTRRINFLPRAPRMNVLIIQWEGARNDGRPVAGWRRALRPWLLARYPFLRAPTTPQEGL